MANGSNQEVGDQMMQVTRIHCQYCAQEQRCRQADLLSTRDLTNDRPGRVNPTFFIVGALAKHFNVGTLKLVFVRRIIEHILQIRRTCASGSVQTIAHVGVGIIEWTRTLNVNPRTTTTTKNGNDDEPGT